jgi:glycosyltransferase involved in cell wall biosynthesis
MLPKSDSLRVLFVLPAFERNGAVEFYVNLADELALLDIDIEVLACRYQELHSRLPSKPVKVNIALEADRFVRLGLFTLLIRLIQSALSSDIIVLTWENGAALLLPSLVAYILRKPTLAIVQNNIQKSLVDYPSRFGGRLVLRWAYAQAQAVVCASKSLIAAVKLEVNQKKITSISNGIDLERVRTLAKL